MACILAFLLISAPAAGQVTPIPSPTVPTMTLDMGSIGPGPITESELLRSFESPTAVSNLMAMPLWPGMMFVSPQTPYLGGYMGSLGIFSPFDPVGELVDFELTFSRSCTEFGITVTAGYSMPVRFYSGATLVGSHDALPDMPLVLEVAGGFDRVEFWGGAGDSYVTSLTIETESGLSAPVLTLTPSAGGELRLEHGGLTPGDEVFVMMTADSPAPGGLGTGPFVGLEATTPAMIGALLQQLDSAVGPTNPFHFLAPGTSASWGPYTLPSGVVLEAVTFYFDPSQATPAVSWVTTTTTLL